jgi:hypothetical protein
VAELVFVLNVWGADWNFPPPILFAQEVAKLEEDERN